jgi:hypothetical protein
VQDRIHSAPAIFGATECRTPIMSRRLRFTRNLGRKLPAPLPVRATAEWVRFEHEHEPYGVFCYISEAEELLSAPERNELLSLRAWFNEHLAAPRGLDLRQERFWFCGEASDNLEKARRLALLIRYAGIPMVERRTRRVPGKVKWHDVNQVAVLTYRDAPQPTRRAP